jgi:hypothetical protein
MLDTLFERLAAPHINNRTIRPTNTRTCITEVSDVLNQKETGSETNLNL